MRKTVSLGLGVSALLAVWASSAQRPASGADRDTRKKRPATGAAADDKDSPPRVVPNENRKPAGRLTNGVLDVHLEVQGALWRPEGPQGPEVAAYAFAEAGRAPSIPGPLIRVPFGTRVRVSLRNTTARRFEVFGLQERPAERLDTVALLPGEEKRVEFRAGSAGTYLYWARAGHDTVLFGQLDDGALSGAIVVDSSGSASVPNERVFVVTLWRARETPPGTPVAEREETLVFNGLAWPHSERLTHTVGDSIHWRVINASRRTHPLHLHGFYFRIDARGTPLRDSLYSAAERRLAVTERLAAGATMSMTWSPHTPGNWLFHCHIVEHITARVNPAAAAQGMAKREGAGNVSTHRNHALEGMSALVLGIEVRPRAGRASRASAAPRRALRLFATETPRVFGDSSAYSFVLQESDREPASDSLRVPGSPIVLTRGEPVAITVLNRMREPVTVHWHGIELESYFDGVGDWSGMGRRIAPAIAPGDSFVVLMTPRRAGTFIYHTHQDETRQLGAGLYGPLLVLDPGQVRDTSTDRILLMGTSGLLAWSPANLNGATSPPPIMLVAGTTYRLRFINITPGESKEVSLQADSGNVSWRVIGKDGADLPPQQAMIRVAQLPVMGAGETWDVEFTPAAGEGLRLEIITTGRGLPPRRMVVPVLVGSR